MKQLHRDDLFGWSVFQDSLDLDFNSLAWVRAGGNVLIDPLPLREHDLEHLRALGGAKFILLTNSMHVRDAQHLAQEPAVPDVDQLVERRAAQAGDLGERSDDAAQLRGLFGLHRGLTR